MAKKENVDLLAEVNDFKTHCNDWLNEVGSSGMSLRDTILDNRRRYQMQLKDRQVRETHNLSALPSTKSTAAVDRVVERALQDYHGDPSAIAFNAKLSDDEGDILKANWLTEDFKYRCNNTFPFFTWHDASLTAGFTDGLEAALVSWKKESYKEQVPVKKYFYVPDKGQAEEINAEIYNNFKAQSPYNFQEVEDTVEQEVVVTDTFWIDQLDPGRNLFWDVKAPLLNLNMGRGVLVIIEKTIDDLLNLADQGVFDKISREELEEYQSPSLDGAPKFNDNQSTVGNADNFDMGDLNCIPLWIYFKRVGCQWKCAFSLKGKKELSGLQDVNKIFFNGRKVHRLPVVMGTCKLKLWEAMGRGLPETIAPIEDEWIDHRNNINDAAKITIRGRYRLEPTSRIKIDDLINAAVFRASKGEYEKIDQQLNLQDSMRAAESINADMSELTPIGMENRQIAPKGTTKTLGQVQLALGQSNEKLSVQLMVRNETFFKPLLLLIAELIFAFETDNTILRLTARKAGYQPMEWNGVVDFRELDLPVKVMVNAGMGSVPRQQKADNALQLFNWGKMNGVRQDAGKMYRMLSSLSGFEPDQFVDKAPMEPPRPVTNFDLAVKVEWPMLPPDLQNFLVQRLMASGPGSEMDAKITAQYNEMMHNGKSASGMPEEMPQDMTQGNDAEMMSQGGMNGTHE